MPLATAAAARGQLHLATSLLISQCHHSSLMRMFCSFFLDAPNSLTFTCLFNCSIMLFFLFVCLFLLLICLVAPQVALSTAPSVYVANSKRGRSSGLDSSTPSTHNPPFPPTQPQIPTKPCDCILYNSCTC